MNARPFASLFLVAGFLFCAAAQAATPGPTTWGCWYDTRTLTVECFLLDAPQLQPAGGTDPALEGSESVLAALPRIARQLRTDPASFKGRRVSIPLYNVPYEMERVRELADSVMCGVRRNCSVEFAGSVPEIALRAEQFDDSAN